MPLYEFSCDACGARFEELVAPGGTAPCPACGNERVTRQSLRDRRARASEWISPGPGRPRVELRRRAEREAAKKDSFVAERKRKRGQGPPGG